MLFFLRDQALVRLLDDSQVRVTRARSKADLLEVLDRLEIFPGGLEFDHVQSIALLVLAIASFAALLLMDDMGVMFWVGLACCFFSYYVMKGLSGSLTGLASNIARKCALFSNDLSEVDSDADWCLKRLNNEFVDYDRGNERRYIVESIQGIYHGVRHSLAFEYYHLQYVSSRSERGAGGSYNTVYETFSRYSLVLDFPWVRGISALTDPQERSLTGRRFKVDCDDFNQAFVLRGSDQACCTSFATPAIQLFLMGLARRLEKVNLEFSSQGRLCLSFDDAEVMAYADPGPLSDLPSFRERIKAGIELPGLYPILELVHRLAELQEPAPEFSLVVAEGIGQ
ncbi:hypothetical protein [Pseudomonas sp. Fl4BN1]|uniref:hypothetical protein n=1 Tax=Pseudomonas sp. Fl4BN1 TaxID=2697651 RepID=UPI0013765DF4|nr:hypothetical protein [Pseudomonas sp. Fl4BN1]NBF10119.1 hypothetical protein [Pseudomonas sp. Fl4BN1]